MRELLHRSGIGGFNCSSDSMRFVLGGAGRVVIFRKLIVHTLEEILKNQADTEKEEKEAGVKRAGRGSGRESVLRRITCRPSSPSLQESC